MSYKYQRPFTDEEALAAFEGLRDSRQMLFIKRKKEEGKMRITISMHINCADISTLEKICSVFGGAIKQIKDYYRITYRHSVLKLLLPHLRYMDKKHDQRREIAIALLNILESRRESSYYSTTSSDFEIERIFEYMKDEGLDNIRAKFVLPSDARAFEEKMYLKFIEAMDL